MRKKLLTTLTFCILFSLFSCNNDDSKQDYVDIPTSPVKVDLTQVPYPKLSDYHFFEGDMKNQVPALNVIPYAPASSLFTDYAYKKRFVWMPIGVKATFNGDSNVLELPVGAALIKTFYYEKVQPSNTTRILETRIMIRKATGWIFANYVWNEAQTEANLDLSGSFVNISWKDESDIVKTTDYRIPSEVQCIICHKSTENIGGTLQTIHIPIGIKPQNLNFNYTYGTSSQNQLTKWIDQGYLESGFSLPSENNTTIDYNDTSESLEKRARSYVDINCAHCHQNGKHCDYRPMRFAFSETGNVNGLTNMGVCVDTQDMQDFAPALSKIVTPGNINRSMLYHRLNTTNEAYRMPLHGRTVIHEEGLTLMGQWINSLQPCL